MGTLGRGISNSKLAAVGVAQKDRDRGRGETRRRGTSKLAAIGVMETRERDI